MDSKQEVANNQGRENEKLHIYLAGPIFTTAERDFNLKLATLLRGKYEVWLPQEDEQELKEPREIFEKDVEGIAWADLIVACMDGPDPDSGTSWECGCAFGLGMPVIVFRTDSRLAEAPGNGPYNLMLTQSATAEITQPHIRIEDLAQKICEKIDSLEGHAKLSKSLRAARRNQLESFLTACRLSIEFRGFSKVL